MPMARRSASRMSATRSVEDWSSRGLLNGRFQLLLSWPARSRLCCRRSPAWSWGLSVARSHAGVQADTLPAMTTSWTRLHEELGLAPVPLTYGHIQQAVAQNVPESAALDWKAKYQENAHGNEELAKDLSAMANSGGGTIVLGVGEVGSGSQKRIVHSDIELTEQVKQRVLAINSTRVHPRIPGVDPVFVHNPDQPGRGVSVISIPASPLAPHFHEKGGVLVAKRRNGPDTEPLRETDIERAYLDRLAGRRRADERLDELEARPLKVRRPDAVRLSTSATPLVAASFLANGGRPRAEGALNGFSKLFQEILAAEAEDTRLVQNTIASLLPERSVSPRVIRPGLRRWRVGEHASVPTYGPYLELHDDGSTLHLADLDTQVLSRDERAGAPWILISAIEQAAVCAVALPVALARSMHLDTTISVRVSMALPTHQHGTGLSRGHTYGGRSFIDQPASQERLWRLDPVVTAITSSSTTADLRAAAAQLARDIANQFGYDELQLLEE